MLLELFCRALAASLSLICAVSKSPRQRWIFVYKKLSVASTAFVWDDFFSASKLV